MAAEVARIGPWDAINRVSEFCTGIIKS
jgi:hypothetical protein